MDAPAQPISTEADRPVGLTGMWVFLLTDASSFLALVLGYAYLRVQAHDWPAHRLAVPFTAGLTLVLVASGGTMTLARAAGARGDGKRLRAWLAATIALGGLFLAGQAREWSLLVHERGAGLAVDQMWSTFFVVTGFHALHVVAGLVLLAATLVLAARGRVGAGLLRSTSLFWHFVDGIWLLVFAAVYLA